eukprot:53206-Chlamydomonas_euryale.AAC.2
MARHENPSSAAPAAAPRRRAPIRLVCARAAPTAPGSVRGPLAASSRSWRTPLVGCPTHRL